MAIPIKIIDKRSVPLAELKNWDKNPRSITKENFERLKQQISRLGVHAPLLVNEEMIVLSGNMRLRAYRELNIDPVEIWVVEARDEATMLEYALSANDHMGETEEESLAELLMSLPSVDQNLFHVDLGHSIPLHELANRFGPDDSEEDEAPALSEEPAISQLGRVYQLGHHRLLCGDARSLEDVDKLMNGQKADMVFTSPPYNLGDNAKLRGPLASNNKKMYTQYNDSVEAHEWLSLIQGFLEVWRPFSQYQFVNIQMLAGNKVAFIEWLSMNANYVSDIAIWDKTHAQPALAERVMSSQFEFVVMLCSDNNPSRAISIAPKFRGTVSNVLSLAPNKPKADASHGAVFPVQFPAHYIQHFTTRGSIVSDPFGGSGSTLIAAEQTGRTCYMMELDPRYCDVIRKRYAQFLGKEDWQAETPELTN